ncbi:MAG TPA: c-type cytochrome, partial [Byssovorax sp.]
AAGQPVGSIQLQDGDEPGRLVEDGAGLVHVALRNAGTVVTVDPRSASLVGAPINVCAAPRGITYDPSTDNIYVACFNGELVTISGDQVSSAQVERGLRDVIVQGDKLLVTKFRTAELLTVDGEGKVTERTKPNTVTTRSIRLRGTTDQFTPEVAWRTLALPNGGVAMLHQRALEGDIVIKATTGSYGGTSTSGGNTPGCDPTIVHTSVSVLFPGLAPTHDAPAIPDALLPVDLASRVMPSGKIELSFVAAGSNKVYHIDAEATGPGTGIDPGCMPDGGGSDGDSGSSSSDSVDGEPVALAYWNDLTVVQTRDPIGITVVGSGAAPIVLPGASSTDTGHNLFHRNDGGEVSLACASCHPEGGDDGHTWHFNTEGARRTQNLSNDVMTTAPFHWDGDMKDLGMIMHEVFEQRMGGVHQGPEHIAALESYMSKRPAMANPVIGDAAAIARGQALFVGTAGCNACHNGDKLTNNETKNVGTGRAFQVPSLVGVVMRAPYMHDGCAATLHDRFDKTLGSSDHGVCGGATSGDHAHGNTADLTSQDVDDLVAYLETL